jgi:hypothetical protein
MRSKKFLAGKKEIYCRAGYLFEISESEEERKYLQIIILGLFLKFTQRIGLLELLCFRMRCGHFPVLKSRSRF